MKLEIERRFLVREGAWTASRPGEIIRQGYLAATLRATVRVRRIGQRGFLTIKGPRLGGVRAEFEYEIPAEEADAMLETLCPHPLIEKTRHKVDHMGQVWDVDVFAGAHAGLVIAECELGHPDQPLALPDWVGAEITGDPRYRSSRLRAAIPAAAIREPGPGRPE